MGLFTTGAFGTQDGSTYGVRNPYNKEIFNRTAVGPSVSDRIAASPLVMWFDVSDRTTALGADKLTPAADFNSVYRLLDKSGNDHHLDNVGTGPSVNPHAYGGESIAGLIFETNYSLKSLDAFTWGFPNTYYFVMGADNWYSGNVFFSSGYNTEFPLLRQYWDGTSPEFNFRASNNSPVINNLPLQTPGVVSIMHTGDENSTFRLNSDAEFVGNWGTSTGQGFMFHGNYVGNYDASRMFVHEFLLYDEVHDLAMRNMITQNLMTKWGIS